MPKVTPGHQTQAWFRDRGVGRHRDSWSSVLLQGSYERQGSGGLDHR